MNQENGQILINEEIILSKIYNVRGKQVMLSQDLAELYQVETKVLNQQVKRNIGKFPERYMFQLTQDEHDRLRSQNVTLNRGQHIKYLPYAFTEHGALMLSGVLNTQTAIETSIFIVRAFVKLRTLLSTHEKLERKITELERKYEDRFSIVFQALKQLIIQENEPRKTIGFKTNKGDSD